MKKKYLMMLALMGAISMSACGNKKAETEAAVTETQAETEAETETEAAEEETLAGGDAADTEIFMDEGYFDGTVTAMSGTQITVLSEAGESYTFEIADAETDPDYDILPGAFVEVSYDGAKNEAGTTDATMVAVLMSLEQQAMDNGEDPALQGTVKEYADGRLVVTDPNGKDHEFDSTIAQVVSGSGLSAGTPVMVTYVGSIDEAIQEDSEEGEGSGTPVAIRIVTPDSVGTENENKISGTVLYVDGVQMMIDTPAIAFEFTAEPSVFAGIAEGDEVTVTYTGSVGNKTVEATAVEKVQ